MTKKEEDRWDKVHEFLEKYGVKKYEITWTDGHRYTYDSSGDIVV